MDNRVLGHENEGSKGSGFTGDTKSNNYVELPRSNNAELGIDSDVAAGLGNSVVDPAREAMTNQKFGIPDEIARGTVPATRTDDRVFKARNAGKRGEFGVSALSGNPPSQISNKEYVGSGGREMGTGNEFVGEPGRSGSMALAIKGLSGNAGGADPEAQNNLNAPAPTMKDMVAARKGIAIKETPNRQS